jgi:phosphoglycolate phosphatase
MANNDFSNIEAIILDKDGVFVNFHKLWLRIIAYRAQLIAELSSDTSEMLVKIRTACIRAMGIDEDDETIDPYGPCSMPLASVRLALATGLFITKNETDPTYKWKEAFAVVDQAIAQTREDLNTVELSEEISGSIKKIQDLSSAGYKLGVFSSDSQANATATVKKFKIDSCVNAVHSGMHKDKESYEEICSQLKVKPQDSLIITDSPIDLKAAKDAGGKAVLVLSGVVTEDMNLAALGVEPDLVIDSLADFDIKKKVAI